MGFLPKDYVWVHTRIEKYHNDHENWGINTEFKIEWKIVIFKATVTTKKWTFTWSSFGEIWKEKAFEKLETVAVWRALAFAWYEVKEWIASNEEMEIFQDKQNKTEKKVETDDLWLCPTCWEKNTKYSSWKIGCSKYCWKTNK